MSGSIELSEVKEIHQLRFDTQVNEYLKEGWKLLKIATKKAQEGPDFSEEYSVFIVGWTGEHKPTESEKGSIF